MKQSILLDPRGRSYVQTLVSKDSLNLLKENSNNRKPTLQTNNNTRRIHNNRHQLSLKKRPITNIFLIN